MRYPSYVPFTSPIGGWTIVSEFEKCLANSSFVYWLILGDLQFFGNATTDAGILNVVRTYAAYVLIIPFCIVFAKLMKARHQASLWLNVLFAGMT